MLHFAPDLAERIPSGVEAVGAAINPFQAENLRQLPPLQERQLAILAYQPFGSGALFEGAQGQDPSQLDVAAVREALRNAARQHHLTLPQVFIHYILQRPAVSNVVIGTSSRQHLEENVNALKSKQIIQEPISIHALLP